MENYHKEKMEDLRSYATGRKKLLAFKKLFMMLSNIKLLAVTELQHALAIISHSQFI